MPYEAEQGAYWALLGPDVELRRTPYDAEAAAQRIREDSGYPDADDFVTSYVLSARDRRVRPRPSSRLGLARKRTRK